VFTKELAAIYPDFPLCYLRDLRAMISLLHSSRTEANVFTKELAAIDPTCVIGPQLT
jgi:hypothetical protein